MQIPNMIHKLQRKFILITAFSVLAVIFVFLFSINGIFFYQRMHLLNSRLDSIFEKNLHEPLFGRPSDIDRENKPEKPSGFHGSFSENPNFFVNGCLIFLDSSGEIISVKKEAEESYAAEDISFFVEKISALPDDQGWIGFYKYRQTAAADETGSKQTKIALVDASAVFHSVLSLVSISFICGLLVFLLILIIVIAASKKAIRPIIQNEQKQRQFITDAGHELKTPITAISASNELARITYGDSEWFDGIDRQVQRLTALVKNLITLSKLEEQQKLTFQKISLSDLVRETAGSFEIPALHAGLTLQLEITELLFVSGDPEALKMLISLLLDNAVKYCEPSGTISVKLTGGRQIHLFVSNTFLHPEAFNEKQIFERFYRGDKSRTAAGNYGLGLSIAKEITELHHGNIRAFYKDNTAVFDVCLNKVNSDRRTSHEQRNGTEFS